MKLTFIGTRGEIQARSRHHFRHSALLVSQQQGKVLIDCGTDWLGHVRQLEPAAIVLTHAHPDHVNGLKQGAPCPVFGTNDVCLALAKYPIHRLKTVQPRDPTRICGVTFEAFTVAHSLRAPTVGWKVCAGRVCFFYAPDLVAIHEPEAALKGIRLYVGDGASPTRPLIRRRGTELIGHASIRQQLEWCSTYHVPTAVFTHCGSAIVTRSDADVDRWLQMTATKSNVRARLAFDGLRIVLRKSQGKK